jgi:uncharacterized membrane protein YhaH (DUF805 family)
MNWYLDVLKKYTVFTGRARRTEYWMFALFNVIAYALIGIIESVAGIPGVLTTLYSLAVLLPNIGVGIRRLHDTNRSGWWLLISLVPCVGFIVLIVFFVQEGTPGDNQFGPNPKALA